MHIVYFTSAQSESSWKTFIPKWKIALNPSNQNFHNKLIRALAIGNQVDVISIRPFSHRNSKMMYLPLETKVEGNITWHYIKRSGNKMWRSITAYPLTKNVLKELSLKNTIFLTDTINPTVLNTAVKAKEKFNRPLIGICTDSPSNISGTKRSFTTHILEKTEDLDGYLALTDGLNELFNPKNRPSYIFEGIVEDSVKKVPSSNEKPYFFFGGALMEKYGVYNLFQAFKSLERDDIELIVCGHHANIEEMKYRIKYCHTIKFLKLLPVDKVIELEQNAIACINPRPYSEDLDRYSIPSKTLEYLNSGSITISVKNSKLMPEFSDKAIWAKSSDVDDLVECLKEALAMTPAQRKAMTTSAKKKVEELYSISKVSKNIQPFLLQFVK